MAAITDLATLAHTDLAVGDWLVVHDLSAATDKKMAPFVDTTWTPTITFGGASTGVAYGTQLGYCVRIGPLFFLRARIVLTAKGSATGAASIGGLPLTVSSTAGHGLRVNYFANMASIVDGIFTLMSSSEAVASLYMGNAATAAALTEANFTNTSRIDFSGVLEL